MKPLYLIAEITPRADRLDDARAAFDTLIEATRREPGCEMYDLVVDPEDPTIWIMIEKWTSHAAWDAHMQAEHVASHNASSSDFLRVPSQLRFYDPA